MSIPVFFLVLIVFAASFAVKTYYYDGVKRHLETLGEAAAESYLERAPETTADEWVSAYLVKVDKKESIDVAAADETGRVVGMLDDGSGVMLSEELAANTATPDEGGFSTGNLPTGEKVMSHTAVIRDENGGFVTALTFYEPLTETDGRVVTAIMILAAAAVIMVAMFVIPSLIFMRTIVKPVRELRATAHKIAQGDYEAKADIRYDDEIGELADSINHMAVEIKASDAMKNDFISSVSHELRTPLTAIQGWAETMSDGEPDPKTLSKGLGIIINESQRLTGMVEELLDFSRIQNGRMSLVMNKANLLTELDEAVNMLKERADKEKKHLIYEPPAKLPPILADKNRLRQVFINIIDNALKYSPEQGWIKIDVVCEDEMIKVVISDSGCGINAKDLPRIKEKFYKANKTVRGSGIGLAVADEIMTLHKGSLDIESEEDKGTKVTISIPMLDEDDEEILKN